MEFQKLKKYVIIICIAFTVFGFATTLEKTVFICNSTTSSKYHLKKNCRGLNACKKPTKEITLADARERGRTLCGWED
mgnify:CR=1 FL=1|jgi:hypothetical protein